MDLKATCPSEFFLHIFFIYSSPPLFSPQRLTWSSRCYLQRGKGWWGGVGVKATDLSLSILSTPKTN